MAHYLKCKELKPEPFSFEKKFKNAETIVFPWDLNVDTEMHENSAFILNIKILKIFFPVHLPTKILDLDPPKWAAKYIIFNHLHDLYRSCLESSMQN